jgi:hypothetical protein
MLKGFENGQMGFEVQKHTEKQKRYYQIYEQIYETPDIAVSQIAKNTLMAEDAVLKLMEEMYAHRIVFPPYLAMKPAENYAEYMHFLEFGSIDPVLPRLKRHPYVISCIPCRGAWNLLVTAFQLMCFKDLAEDFCIPLYQGRRGLTVTPKCSPSSSFEIGGERKKGKRMPDLKIDWNEKGWMLYRGFRENMRKDVTPFLKEKKICYKEYIAWKKTVYDYCSVHTLFYPLGFYRYVHWYFLMETGIGISSLFEEWPCSCIFIEVTPFVVAHVSAPVNEEKKLLRVSQWLWNDLEITGFCAAPLYPQSRTYSQPNRAKRRWYL